MHKRIIASLGMLAVLAALVPSVSLAKETNEQEVEKHLPRISSMNIGDIRGDSNGLAKYKKHSENRNLKVVDGVVTAISCPVSPETVGSLTVKKSNGKSYIFAFDATGTAKYTTFLRKYKSTATCAEVLVGDSVKVFTTKLEKGKAVIVWDRGTWYAQARGVVSNLNSGAMAFTLTVTKNTIEYSTTVVYSAATKFYMDGVEVTAEKLTNDATVKVQGSWDSVLKKFVATRIVISS